MQETPGDCQVCLMAASQTRKHQMNYQLLHPIFLAVEKNLLEMMHEDLPHLFHPEYVIYP